MRKWLEGLVRAQSYRSSSPLRAEQVERVCELASRPGCFAPALELICEAAPWRVASLVGQAAPGAWRRGERFVPRLGAQWQLRTFIPYRLELLRSAAAIDGLFTALCARVAKAPTDTRLAEILELTASPEAEETTAAYAQMVARAFYQGGATLRRSLLIHPRDCQAPLATQASFERDKAAWRAYAAKVQAGADELLRDHQTPIPATFVGRPRFLDAAMEPLENRPQVLPHEITLAVPVWLGAVPAGELPVMRLADRFKVAPCVRAVQASAGGPLS